MSDINLLKVILHLIAGLVIFLFGVSQLSESLGKLAGDKMRDILARFTANVWMGVLTGTLVTLVLDSSSAVIIMVIALVNAGLLNFRQSLGVILGANIGTTFSSQIIAFKVAEYASIALLVGFIGLMLLKNERAKHWASVVLAMGFVFFGLEVMDTSVLPFRRYEPFMALMRQLASPWTAVATGALFTFIIQSSSATVAIVITLAGQGLIDFPTAVALMLGAEIGTCSDTLLATIRGTREAIRAGVFHLLFNISTVILGLMLLNPFIELVLWISEGASIERKIANAHTIFNISGVLALVLFVPWIEKGMTKLIPDRLIPQPVKSLVESV
jgi:phosphate:Na+ symporter